MNRDNYHQDIIDYYRDTEHAYRDSWDLDKSLAIHYGYSDEKAKTFSQSLLRMNAVMMEMAGISEDDEVLDAGCGVGGSAIYLSGHCGCSVTGITLSPRQAEQATMNAAKADQKKLKFHVMDYCNTGFPDASFDVVWGCESICYASRKEKFIREAYRLLKPGGRLIVADGFVTSFEFNSEPVIRKWLDGWKVNYLETAARFQSYMKDAGFEKISYRNISKNVSPSSSRLYRFYFLARAYLLWRKISGGRQPTAIQVKNIEACKYQYKGLKKKLWEYGIVTGKKPVD